MPIVALTRTTYNESRRRMHHTAAQYPRTSQSQANGDKQHVRSSTLSRLMRHVPSLSDPMTDPNAGNQGRTATDTGESVQVPVHADVWTGMDIGGTPKRELAVLLLRWLHRAVTGGPLIRFTSEGHRFPFPMRGFEVPPRSVCATCLLARRTIGQFAVAYSLLALPYSLLTASRRAPADDERLAATSEAWIFLAMIRSLGARRGGHLPTPSRNVGLRMCDTRCAPRRCD